MNAALRANFFDCIQGSPEWLKLRAGCVTSSRVKDAVSYFKRKSGDKQKGDETQSRANYRKELIAERLSGECTDHYVSQWMKEGREKEPQARAAYELEIGQLVDQIGFVLHPEIEWCGSSPDSLIGDDGLAEYKCPKIATHLEYLFGGVIPVEYEPQMLWQLACDPERQWNDFVSFCPALPKPYRIFIRRMERDNKRIAEMEAEVNKFLREVDDGLIRLKEQYAGGESLEAVRLRQSIEQARRSKAGPQLVTESLDDLGITEEDSLR